MTAPAKPAQDPPRDAELRLAAALRENLTRRKEQARAQKDRTEDKIKNRTKSPPEGKTGG